MALQAIAVEVRDAPSPGLAHAGATITELRPVPRTVTVAAARQERRKWLVIAALVFASPFVACLGVLEVVR